MKRLAFRRAARGPALAAILCWAAPVPASCSATDLMEWRGVESFDIERLERAAAEVGAGDSGALDIDCLGTVIVEAYRAEGFLDASVRLSPLEDGEPGVLLVEVIEGPRYVMGDISFEGASRLSAGELIEACPGLSPGAPFSRDNLSRSLEDLLRVYCAEGYAQCRVSPKSFRPGPGPVMDLTVRVAEGPRRVVEGVSVTGGSTRSETAAKLAGLKAGSPFDPYGLPEVKARLSSSGFFSEVGDPVAVPGTADSLVMIEVAVKEPPSSSISGLLGYSGREGGAVGFADLNLGNIMGTGRAGSFRWESSGRGLSSYRAGYREPWLGGLPVALELGVDHVTQDTTYSTTSLSADLRVQAGRGFSFALGMGRERTSVAGPIEGLAGKRTRTALRAGAQLDLRDRALDARSGALLSAEGSWGARHDVPAGAGEARTWNLTRLGLRAEVHRPIHGRHGLFFGAGWSKIFTDQASVPNDQLLRFGGAASLRGYREDQFHARETALLQVEHRISLGGGSRIFFFTDLGALGGDLPAGGLLLGYGLGLRAPAAGGLMGLDFALGEGDSWGEGKVHVRMTRAF